jgi:hypothetical protein
MWVVITAIVVIAWIVPGIIVHLICRPFDHIGE